MRAIPARTGEALAADAGMAAWLIHADGREHRSEVYEIAFEAGVEQRTEAHLPGTEEVIVCVEGRLRVGPLGEPVELEPGDAVWFAADVAHAYVALADARALCWMLYPTAAALTMKTGAGASQPVIAGVVASLVGFASTFALVLAGLRAVGASEAEAASGLATLCFTMSVVAIGLGLRYRQPLAIAWSTPGAALLVAGGEVPGGYPAALGAFAVTGVLIVIAGLWRTLGRWVEAIPPALASAMLAGVLLPVCLAPVEAAVDLPAQALPVIATWVVLMRVARRWAVPGALAVAAVVIAVDPRESAAPLEVLPALDLDDADARRGRAARARPAAVRGDDGLAERHRHRGAAVLRLPPADHPGAREHGRRDRRRARRSAPTRSTSPPSPPRSWRGPTRIRTLAAAGSRRSRVGQRTSCSGSRPAWPRRSSPSRRRC